MRTNIQNHLKLSRESRASMKNDMKKSTSNSRTREGASQGKENQKLVKEVNRNEYE